MKTDDIFFETVEHERRKEKRKKVEIPILIKMGTLINGRGITRDISKHGLRLKSLQIFKVKINSKDLTGASIRIMIPSQNISINGLIVWADLKTGEGAINIVSISDENQWQKICE